MLDRAKVLRELHIITDNLFLDLRPQTDLAFKIWQDICKDPLFRIRCMQSYPPWLIPQWQEILDKTYAIAPLATAYSIMGIDGSQIYPDRHQGSSCYLINIGTATFRYNMATLQNQKSVEFFSKPFVFLPEQQSGDVTDLVNYQRQELEFDYACIFVKNCIEENRPLPDLILFDGSLIFWHLESKPEEIKKQYIEKYLKALDIFYEHKVLIAWYISVPKNKELLNLIRLKLANFDPNNNTDYKKVDNLVDLHVLSFFLEEEHRSIIFENQSSITQYYNPAQKPYFYYMHTGQEYGRVEIPAWIAQNPEYVEKISTLILDQTKKGFGYPICLAEAHEQAVVKGPDRDFFYHCIQKISIEQRKRITCSQKSMKKRMMNI